MLLSERRAIILLWYSALSSSTVALPLSAGSTTIFWLFRRRLMAACSAEESGEGDVRGRNRERTPIARVRASSRREGSTCNTAFSTAHIILFASDADATLKFSPRLRTESSAGSGLCVDKLCTVEAAWFRLDSLSRFPRCSLSSLHSWLCSARRQCSFALKLACSWTFAKSSGNWCSSRRRAKKASFSSVRALCLQSKILACSSSRSALKITEAGGHRSVKTKGSRNESACFAV